MRNAMPPAFRIWPTMTQIVSRTMNPPADALMSKVMENPSEMKKIGPRNEYAIPRWSDRSTLARFQTM